MVCSTRAFRQVVLWGVRMRIALWLLRSDKQPRTGLA